MGVKIVKRLFNTDEATVKSTSLCETKDTWDSEKQVSI